MAESTLITQLKQMAAMLKNSNQGSFYQSKVDSAKDVKVVSCSEVLTKAQINHIKNVIKPQKRECYRNALLVAQYLGCEYCEGQMLLYFGIDHAFNKVGDKYIDVTKEFALEEKPEDSEYITIGEYSADEAMRVAVERGIYGDVFNYKFIENLKR